MLCPNCGGLVDEEVMWCEHCEMDFGEPDLNEEICGMKVEDLKLFLDTNSTYYLIHWKIRNPESQLQFNFVAFFFGVFWFGFRKMYPQMFFVYGIGIVLQIMSFLVLIISASLDVYLIFTLVLSISFAIYIGFKANSLYFKHAKKKIIRLSNIFLDQNQRRIEIAKAGGTSWLGLLGAIALHVIVALFRM